MEGKHTYRTVITYASYFEDFMASQRQKVRDKIYWTLELIEEVEKVPETYLKHLEGQMDFTKSECKWAAIFLEYSVFSTQVDWSYWQMGFRKRLKKHLKKK